MKHGKRYAAAAATIERGKVYDPQEAFAKIPEIATAKFDETIEAHVKLDELEISWKNLHIPNEYDTSFDMLVNDKCSKEDIYGILPYSHIYIYVMKLITYLFYNNSKFDTELSLLSSLNQICIDKAENKEKAEYIMEHISYQQDIAMAKDKEKEEIIKAAMAENAEAFKNICF